MKKYLFLMLLLLANIQNANADHGSITGCGHIGEFICTSSPVCHDGDPTGSDFLATCVASDSGGGGGGGEILPDDPFEALELVWEEILKVGEDVGKILESIAEGAIDGGEFAVALAEIAAKRLENWTEVELEGLFAFTGGDPLGCTTIVCSDFKFKLSMFLSASDQLEAGAFQALMPGFSPTQIQDLMINVDYGIFPTIDELPGFLLYPMYRALEVTTNGTFFDLVNKIDEVGTDLDVLTSLMTDFTYPGYVPPELPSTSVSLNSVSLKSAVSTRSSSLTSCEAVASFSELPVLAASTAAVGVFMEVLGKRNANKATKKTRGHIYGIAKSRIYLERRSSRWSHLSNTGKGLKFVGKSALGIYTFCRSYLAAQKANDKMDLLIGKIVDLETKVSELEAAASTGQQEVESILEEMQFILRLSNRRAYRRWLRQ